MQNLYIVNTPFQLLTAYILAQNPSKGIKNHLLLLQPHGYEKWENSFSLQYMCADLETWQKVSLFENWLNRKTGLLEIPHDVNRMREALHHLGKVDKVYMGSDKSIPNQLIAEISGNTHFHRFDEGLGSYFSRTKRHWSSKKWHLIRINFMRMLGGLHSNMQYNVEDLGLSRAAKSDYLYKPNLLKRPSPESIAIDRKKIKQVLEKITHNMQSHSEFDSEKSMLFLSSPLVELGYCTLEQEIAILENIVEMAEKNGFRVIYKPHPWEKGHKIELYQKRMPKIQFFQCIDPVEILYYAQKKIKFVLSYLSSGLLYTDIFATHKIVPISLVNLYERDAQDAVYVKIMEEAGVCIPTKINDIEQIIKADY